jgi:hypothetical protein
MGIHVLEDPLLSIAPNSVEANIGHTPLLRLGVLNRDLPHGVEMPSKRSTLIRGFRERPCSPFYDIWTVNEVGNSDPA